jgi:hypothetical protein
MYDLSAEAFDHRIESFDLPTLSVATFVQMAFHLSAIAACRFAASRSAMGGRHQGLNPQLVTR